MKRFLISFILVITVLSGFAETVSQKQAREMANMFFNEAYGRVTAPPNLVYNGRKLTTNRLFSPFYVYNSSLGGFVIIPADNKAFPILGFSLKESFDPDRLGDAELALLSSYALEIEMVRYDTQSIDATVGAWQNYPNYVSSVLKSPYLATDPRFSLEEAAAMISRALADDDAVFSDIYTPSQWRDMIIDELSLKESAPLAIEWKDGFETAVVYGYQGDFFRLELSRRNNWLMRLNATEVIPSNMVSAVVNPLLLPLEFNEPVPFEEHDRFISEVKDIESRRVTQSSVDIPVFDGQPMIKANGGGRFEIYLPENARLARVYNLSGAMVARHKYSDTSVANIDISAAPSGFYFVTVEGESGSSYGFKIYR